MAEPLRVVCAVLERGDRVLAARRPEGKALAGLWEFPGGKIEPGETPPEALVRELREELGIEAVVGAALTPVRHAHPGGLLELHPFRCRTGGEPAAAEHAELRWCLPEELEALAWAPADIPIVRELLAARPAP